MRALGTAPWQSTATTSRRHCRILGAWRLLRRRIEMLRRRLVLLQLIAVAAAAAGILASQAFASPLQTACILVVLTAAASLGVCSLVGLDRERVVHAEARRLKTEMLANVSHELRTPLNAILGYAEILDSIAGLHDRERAEMNGRILANAVTLTCAVNNLLEYSSVVAGETVLRRGTVSLRELFEEIEPWVGHLIDDKPIHFAWEVDPQVPAIETDRGKLRQALLNVLANAAKFTSRGEIRLSAVTGPAGIEIEVRDTGIGMTAAERSVVFEDFRQVEGSITRPFGGMGLGLTLVHCFSELLGGNVMIDSVPAKGTRVSLRLPIAQARSGNFSWEAMCTSAAA
ncbi:MAG: HAMP domain-containing sensor histidine kinase [Myxococcales bacterium]|nr:HAMP domain-containing sensor histidine kinase [Myxococcales bacterium]